MAIFPLVSLENNCSICEVFGSTMASTYTALPQTEKINKLNKLIKILKKILFFILITPLK